MTASRRWALFGLLSLGLAACGPFRANNQDADSPDYGGEAGRDMFRPGCDPTESPTTPACAGDR